MAATPEIRNAILSGLSAVEIETLAAGEGMTPLRKRCLDLVREGVTSFDEFARLRL
jgi:type II secretory ATPase GspE/PulE/Tfp pilus assembly ATPase PilB-like protein